MKFNLYNELKALVKAIDARRDSVRLLLKANGVLVPDTDKPKLKDIWEAQKQNSNFTIELGTLLAGDSIVANADGETETSGVVQWGGAIASGLSSFFSTFGGTATSDNEVLSTVLSAQNNANAQAAEEKASVFKSVAIGAGVLIFVIIIIIVFVKMNKNK